MSTSKQMKYIDSTGKETIVDIAVNAANVENNTFTQAAARTNIASGETLPGIFGKLSKWFADLKAVAWSGKYSDLTDRPALGAAAAYGVANDCGTTAANYVLDARQGQVLQANINQVNNNLTGSINAVSGTLSGLNGAVAPYLTGCVVTSDGVNFYAQYGGLKKKLGDLPRNINCVITINNYGDGNATISGDFGQFNLRFNKPYPQGSSSTFQGNGII